jgi:hypothetical protein
MDEREVRFNDYLHHLNSADVCLLTPLFSSLSLHFYNIDTIFDFV